jgi:hypothetical protein
MPAFLALAAPTIAEMAGRKLLGKSKKRKKKNTDVFKMNSKERFAFYMNDRTPWVLQKTVIPLWPSDIVRNLKWWFVFWLMWWGVGVKKRIGKSFANSMKRVLVIILLFHTYTKRLAR